MKTDWKALSKKLGVLKDDGTELYEGINSSQALEEILGDEWLHHTLDTFIEGTPGNELAIKTLRFISSTKAAEMAYKIYTDSKDTNQQKASMAVWALSDIRTPLAMDYVEEIMKQPKYEGIALTVFRNLVFDHLSWFEEKRMYRILENFTEQYAGEKSVLKEYLNAEFKISEIKIEDFSVNKFQFLEGIISKNENQMYHIQIPIAPFMFEQQTVHTNIDLTQINLPNDLADCINRSFTFPVNPSEGYIDGSIYVAERHNPVDVTEIKFLNQINSLIEVEMKMHFDFEYEGTGLKNGTLIKKLRLAIK